MATSLGGITLRDLEYALAVNEHRHFGRAASACGVSQPGLSEGLRKLETQLGTTLFERGRGFVAPTEAAPALLAQAAEVLRHARTLLEMGASGRAAPLRRLRLGAIPTLGPYYLPFLFRAVRSRFPLLEVEVAEEKTPDLVAALHGGRLDAAILALPLPAPDGLAVAALFDEPLRLALPAGHQLEDVPDVKLATLAGGDELLLLEEGHCLREQTVSMCSLGAPGGLTRRQASSLEMLRHMVAAGEGYALMPLLALRDGGDRDGLIATRPLADPQANRSVALAWRASDPRAEHFCELAAFLADAAPSGTLKIASEEQRQTGG